MSFIGEGSSLRNSFRKLGRASYNTADSTTAGTSINNNEEAVGIYLQTFAHHWAACQDRLQAYEPLSCSNQDDVLNVLAQLEQMCQLYQLELCAGQGSTSILDLILSENILGQLVSWSKSLPTSLSDPLLIHLATLLTSIINFKGCNQSLLTHQTVLRPLLALLDLFQSTPGHSQGLEVTVLEMVHNLWQQLSESPDLLHLFTFNESKHNNSFMAFTLLTQFLHKPGLLGQQARESLLVCVSLSSKNESLEQYISYHSNFCTILATGLSGLFSALPRNLEADHPSWHRLDSSDAQDIPGLSLMLTSLELCSAVIEVAPPGVERQLLELVEQGFLIPVLGPALVAEAEQEAIVSSTAYVDLFLQKVTAPSLTALLLRFILTGSVDGKSIKDVLVARLHLTSQVCTVTLCLFETMLSFNMEDVLFSLVFQYLLSGSFLLPDLRENLHFTDPQGRSAHKFLSLVPVSCDPPGTPLTPRRSGPFSSLPPLVTSPRHSISASTTLEFLSSSTAPQMGKETNSPHFAEYLRDARDVVRTTALDCLGWRNRYDEATAASSLHHQLPAKHHLSTKRSIPMDRPEVAIGKQEEDVPALLSSPLTVHIVTIDDAIDQGPSSLGGESSSGYLSGNFDAEPEDVVLSPEEEREFWSAVGANDVSREKLNTVLSRLQHEDRLSMSSLGQESSEDAYSSPRGPPLISHTDIGHIPPSLGPFLTSLLEKVENFSYNSLNLNLQLTAVISKLASFPQPLLRSVLTHPDMVVQPSCTTLVQAICTARSRIDSAMPGMRGSEEGIRLAREFLAGRVTPLNGRSSTASIVSLPAAIGEYSRRSSSKLLGILGKKSSSSTSPAKRAAAAVPQATRQLAMAAVLLEEWLQELAALAQEHSCLQQQWSVIG